MQERESLKQEMSLGQELRQRREALRIELRDVVNATNISIRYLQAIENDKYSELPGGIINRSFIRNFARRIRYDEVRAIRLYEEQFGVKGVPTPPHFDYGDVKGFPSLGEDELLENPLVNVLLVLIVLAAVTFAVYYYLRY